MDGERLHGRDTAGILALSVCPVVGTWLGGPLTALGLFVSSWSWGPHFIVMATTYVVAGFFQALEQQSQTPAFVS